MKHQKSRMLELLSKKELRDKKRYTQLDIAAGTGLTGAAISRIMRQENIDNLTYLSAKALAQWFEVSMEELGSEDEE
jgi:transcriptional regulator with XRE-family HTH domain